MKLIASLLLLFAVCDHFQATLAGFAGFSLDLIENFNITENLPEPPLVLEQDNIYDVKEIASEEELPEIPLEIAGIDHEGRADECSIKIRSGLTNPSPVFLVTDEAVFYPFSDEGLMQVSSGGTLQMFCSGQFKSFATSLITATCVSGTTFRVDGTTYKFSELVCKSWPSFMVKNTDSECNGGTLLKVGFEISSNRFVEQMEVCFNEEEEVTRYVYHTLQPGNNYYQTGVKRPNFQTAGFFGGKNVDKLYTQKSQQQIINDDLGGNGDKYFNNSRNIYLARGHLSAKADMMYGSQQRATFLFINVAPQWQVFNAGNWARVEDGVRAWVSKNKISVDCYTGVYGVTTLPNSQGHETPLYLAHDENNNGLIPVPMLYFRVVIEPKTEKGIVFVGVNNPHLTMGQIQRDYIICDDISDQVNYINWRKTDITAGYSYACEVSDFRDAVENLPELSANGGLLV